MSAGSALFGLADAGLAPDHALFDLQTLAALALGRVDLRADVPHADAVAPMVDALRALCGGEPDAELLELPDGGLGLAARFGACSLDAALHLVRRLSLRSPDVRLLPREPNVWRRAVEEGRLVADALEHDGLRALRWTRTDTDAPCTFEVDAFRPLDPEVMGALSELRDRLADHPECPPLPDDGAAVVVRRRDGRVGLRLRFDGPPQASLAAAAFRVVAGFITGRAGHTSLRFAPDATWDLRLCPELIVWLIAAPASPLPGGDSYGPWGDPAAVSALVSRARLHLDDDDDAAERLAAALDEITPGVVVGAPLAIPTSSGHRLVPTLELPPGCVVAPDPTLRVVPDLLVGLETLEHSVELVAAREDDRWFVRVRDVLSDRDLLEQTTPRRSAPADHARVDTLMARLEEGSIKLAAAANDRWLATVQDGQGRHGLRLWIDARAHRAPEDWRRLLSALAFRDADLEPVATVAFGPSGLSVHLWYRATETPTGARPWAPAP